MGHTTETEGKNILPKRPTCTRPPPSWNPPETTVVMYFSRCIATKAKRTERNKSNRAAGGWEAGLMITRGADSRKWTPRRTAWETRQQRDLLGRALSCSGIGETKYLRRQEWTWEEKPQDRLKFSLSSKDILKCCTQHWDSPSSFLEAYTAEISENQVGCGDKWTFSHWVENPALCFRVFPEHRQLESSHLDKSLDDLSLGIWPPEEQRARGI